MQFLNVPAAAFDHGNACLDRGEAAHAIAAFRHCLDYAPDHPAALFNLANAQCAAGQTTAAVASLLRCLRRAPAFTDARINLATVLLRMGLLDEALGMAESAAALMPASPAALLCLGGIQHHAGAFDAAVATYRRAIRHDPCHAAALSSLGNSLHAAGRMDEALDAHARAIAVAPADADCRYNRALTLLAAGAFAEGWAEHEWRWRRPGHEPRFTAQPWRGESLDGRTILLHAEQGLGDTLQFVRYAPLVAARGGRVVLEVQRPLMRLLEPLPGVAWVVARGDPLPRFDAHCPLMSLPLALGDPPPSAPYLRADPEATAHWRAHLAGGGERLVGLVWAGASHRDTPGAMLLDRRRSMSPRHLAGLADMPGVRFVSLQKDARTPDIGGLTIVDAMDEMHDFADTAAMIGALDLVISVDTSVAHLAAGMGRPVWLLSRFDGCWRWQQERSDTPWYPTMRIFRQTRPGDWPELIERIQTVLERWLDGRILESIR